MHVRARLDDARRVGRTGLWPEDPRVQVVAPVVLPAIARHEFVDARVSAASSSVLLRDRDRRS